MQIFFRDGSATERIAVEYPLGHRRRRAEGIPLLLQKFENSLRGRIPSPRAGAIITLCADRAALEATPVCRFMELFAV